MNRKKKGPVTRHEKSTRDKTSTTTDLNKGFIDHGEVNRRHIMQRNLSTAVAFVPTHDLRNNEPAAAVTHKNIKHKKL